MSRRRTAVQKQLMLLAIAAAVLPFVTFNGSYLIAASLEHVPMCFTYLDGCTSVSSTGRQSPEMFFFKPGVLILAAVLAVHWHRCAWFLGGRDDRANAARRRLGSQRADHVICFHSFDAQ